MARSTRRKTTKTADPRQTVAEAPGKRLSSFMAETNGGGSPESVPGFNIFRAATAGFDTTYISGPTLLSARPDGGYYSSAGPGGPRRPGQAYSAKPENVIGADNRVRVPDTAMTPWRCICHLEVQYDYGPVGAGTGFFIGKDTIITAAHVLVDRTYYGWAEKPRRAKRVRIIPGRDGNLAPYGVFVCDIPSEKDDKEELIPPCWMKIGEEFEQPAMRHDYAAIRVPNQVREQDLGNRIGFFGMKAQPRNSQMLFVNTAGYPQAADKPYGTLWYNAGRTADSDVDDDYVDYMVDTEGGQSGSPVYFFDSKLNQRYVIAIHTTGDFTNRGILITDEVFKRIAGWAGRESEVET